MTKNTNPLLVIGWDAATWDLLEGWVAEGKLPTLAKLMKRGSYGTLMSVPQPVSPAAWSSIITGQNPAKHSVYDWFERKPDSYDVEYVHTGRIASKPIWRYFNEGGKRIGVFNLPMLYPAVDVNGWMLSGLAAPSAHADNFAHPDDLVKELESKVGAYIPAEPKTFNYGREQDYLDAMLHWFNDQKKHLLYLMETHPCDVYFLVFVQTDHAQHKFWRYQDPTFPGYDPARDAPHRDAILKIFQGMDALTGDLIAAMPKETTTLVLSDHGAGPMHGVMYINRWLREEGLLHLKRSPGVTLKSWLAKTNLVMRLYRVAAALGLGDLAKLVSKPARNKVVNSFISFDDIDWSRTKAYARGSFGQVYVNRVGREPEGIVTDAEYEGVVDDILARLRALRHPTTGEPLITNPRHARDLYEGPYRDRAADINFCVQDYLYQASIKMGLESTSILGESEYEDSGSHRPNGMYAFAGPGVAANGQVDTYNVTDVLPTMLALANLPVPTALDGKPMLAALTDEITAQITFTDDDDATTGKAAPEMSADETAELEDRLRSLGYLG
jgi:predicted AlkP superfamily phosphohydrolase/phosphomutase